MAMDENVKSFSCVVKAHAKVNVTLDILGVRPDGFHDLRSIVMPIELCDDVKLDVITQWPEGSVFPQLNSQHSTLNTSLMPIFSLAVASENVDISELGSPEKNLCVRAARLFFERAAEKGVDLSFISEVKISVVKRIPLGGGLGGGSADAAAVLRGLNRLAVQVANSELFNADALTAIGAELGSDVPALIAGGAVLMEGRGERVTWLPGFGGPYYILLANPGIHVSTPLAYKAYDSFEFGDNGIAKFGARSSESVSDFKLRCSRSADAEDSVPPLRSSGPADIESLDSNLTDNTYFSRIDTSRNCGKSLSDFSVMLTNGLEKPVFELYPEIAELSRRLKESGAEAVLMSGSGATVFALCKSPEDAKRLSACLPKDYWMAVSRMMPDGVMAAHGPLEA